MCRLPLIVAMLAVLLTSGCAVKNNAGSSVVGSVPEIVQKGGFVKFLHSCSSGRTSQVLSTTLPAELDQPSIVQSQVFFPPRQDGVWGLFAGVDPGGEKYGMLDLFENRLATELSFSLVGLEVGEDAIVTLSADTPKDLPENERYLRIRRQQYRPATTGITTAEFERRYKHSAAEGEVVFERNGLTGVVESVVDDRVSIKVTAAEGAYVQTPFGKGTVEIEKDGFRVVTHPQLGALVKSSFLLGRISEISESHFIIDYGNPFGGDDLICQVKVLEKKSGDDFMNQQSTASDGSRR